MRHIALEVRCWDFGSGDVMSKDDIPVDSPGYAEMIQESDFWIHEGASVIVNPEGEIVAGPFRKEHGILYAEVDPALVTRKRYDLGVAGHYARLDIFDLGIQLRSRNPIHFATGVTTVSSKRMLDPRQPPDGRVPDGRVIDSVLVGAP